MQNIDTVKQKLINEAKKSLIHCENSAIELFLGRRLMFGESETDISKAADDILQEYSISEIKDTIDCLHMFPTREECGEPQICDEREAV